MELRRLGRTGYSLAAAGFGATALGGAPGRDAPAAQRALYHAIERGVRLVEHGDGGPGALPRIGEVVRDLRLRDQVAVAIRVPALHDVRVPDEHTLLRWVFTPASIKAAIDAALVATRLEVLPLAQLAIWHDAWLDDESWPELQAALARQVQDGKVLHWGVIADGAPATRVLAHVATIAVTHHVFAPADADLLAAAAQAEVGVIGLGPLAGGLLTGELGATATWKPHDPRRAQFPPALLAAAAPRLAKLAALVERTPPAARSTDDAREALERAERLRHHPRARIEAVTLTELALRFALAAPAVTSIAVGCEDRDQVDGAIAAADGRAPSAWVLERLAEHRWDPEADG